MDLRVILKASVVIFVSYFHIAFMLDWMSAGSEREYSTHRKKLTIRALLESTKHLRKAENLRKDL